MSQILKDTDVSFRILKNIEKMDLSSKLNANFQNFIFVINFFLSFLGINKKNYVSFFYSRKVFLFKFKFKNPSY